MATPAALKKLQVPALRTMCTELGVSSFGGKDELITRITSPIQPPAPAPSPPPSPKSSNQQTTGAKCKRCDKTPIQGNYGFCSDHRSAKSPFAAPPVAGSKKIAELRTKQDTGKNKKTQNKHSRSDNQEQAGSLVIVFLLMFAIAASCTAAHLYLSSQHLELRLEAVTAERDVLLLKASHTTLDGQKCESGQARPLDVNDSEILLLGMRPITLVALWGAVSWFIMVIFCLARPGRSQVVDGHPIAFPVEAHTAGHCFSPSSESQDLDSTSKCDSSCSNTTTEDCGHFDPPSAAIVKPIN